MFAFLARLAFRRHWYILGAFAILFPLMAVVGGTAFNVLQAGGFDDPGSESGHVKRVIDENLGGDGADVIALYTLPPGKTVEDPDVQASIRAAMDRARRDPDVRRATTFYDTGSPDFVSADGTMTFALISLHGTDTEKFDSVERLKPELEAEGMNVELGGTVPVAATVQDTVESDLRRAEMIALPITAVLLVAIFGSLVSAGVPLALGAFAMVMALTVLRVLAAFTDVSIFAVNIVSVLGLGLAIDYSLFILNRYREELPGRSPEQALTIAMSTTGRAVAFSGVTVAISLLGLFLFPQMFLRSMALGGIAVTLGAVLVSLTLLPALIATLGSKIDAWRVPGIGTGRASEEGGFWHRIAFGVMRRPVMVAVVVVGMLLVLASPFLRFQGSIPDHRVLGRQTEARHVSESLDAQFTPHMTTPHEIVIDAKGGNILSPRNIGGLYDYVRRVEAEPGVTRVDSIFSLAPGLTREQYMSLFSQPPAELEPKLAAAIPAYAQDDTALVSAISTYDIDEGGAQRQVDHLRDLPGPQGMTTSVGGTAATLADLKGSIETRGPLMITFIAVAMFVVLFLVFGSVTLPVKAILMNTLSLSATYGAMVWIFQDGRLEGLLRYESLGTVDATNPILMFAIVFGLSMDYEVLLLSRVREEYNRTGDNTLAVARGLEKTGRLITSAALLLVVVIAAFATSGVIFVKEMGVGMALAIALDATIVRALLVPALMRLMGRWNWWSPRPLASLWGRVGLGDLEGHARELPAGAGGGGGGAS
ncbi:MAG TPA: MMPL family transporter [Tepidiformaceae bacterium]|nr:MMPL family transporter [Tepidiformaceae bacterium]